MKKNMFKKIKWPLVIFVLLLSFNSFAQLVTPIYKGKLYSNFDGNGNIISNANFVGSFSSDSTFFTQMPTNRAQIGDVITATGTNATQITTKFASPSSAGAIHNLLAFGIPVSSLQATMKYITPVGTTTSSSENPQRWVVPYSGTISNLVVFISTSAGNPFNGTNVFAVVRLGATGASQTNTAISVYTDGANSTLNWQSTASVAVSAGDFIDIGVTNNASGATAVQFNGSLDYAH